MKVLALEASTTSAKAMLFDTVSGKQAYCTCAYPAMLKDTTLHDAETVFRSMMHVGKELASGQQIDIISLSGTWHSVLLCGKDLLPVSPVFLWSNTDASLSCTRLREDRALVQRLYQETGCMVNAIYPREKLRLFSEQHSLDGRFIMGQGTYNMFRMTGECVITECMASGTGLLDLKKRTWSTEILDSIGIQTEQLCRIVSWQESFPLHKEAADMLGLKAGIPVLAANSDGGLNQIEEELSGGNVMTFSMGTSGAIRLSVSEPFLPEIPSIWCYLSPDSYLAGSAVSGCCNCLDWFRNRVAAGMPYEELERQTCEDPPIFLPFLFGERCPGWNDGRYGGFVGLKPEHDLGSMYQGIQEGILFNLFQGYLVLKELYGEPGRIRLSGGVLHSPGWCRMCADIFGREIELSGQEQGSLAGAVVLGLRYLKESPDRMKTEGSVIRPDPRKKAAFMKRFELYKEAYDRTG